MAEGDNEVVRVEKTAANCTASMRKNHRGRRRKGEIQILTLVLLLTILIELERELLTVLKLSTDGWEQWMGG